MSGLRLQQCTTCGLWQYPSRAVCKVCLSGDLAFESAPPQGTVQAWTQVHRSHARDDAALPDRGIASVHLAVGPTILAHAAGPLAAGVLVNLRGDAAVPGDLEVEESQS